MTRLVATSNAGRLMLIGAAWTIGLALTHNAQARALSAADLQRIEHINQERNAQHVSRALQASDPICGFYAVNKAYDLVKAGYGPGEVLIAVVTTERGEPHAIAEVKGTLKGKPVTIVLDNRHEWTASRGDLEATGYTWDAEFTR